MSLGVIATVFALIAVAELPDKTMIATLVMGARGRPLLVWLGASGAFLVHVTVAVVAGRFLELLPHRTVEIVVTVIFLLGAAYLLFIPEKREEARGEREAGHELSAGADPGAVLPAAGGAGAPVATATAWRIVAGAFGVILVGEIGDLTQLLVLNLSAHYHKPYSVFTGALAGLVFISGVAAFGGRALLRVLPLAAIRRLGGVILLGFGVYSIVNLVRGMTLDLPPRDDSDRERLEALMAIARDTRGFMPDDEGEALLWAALRAGQTFRDARGRGTTMAEIGAWCGKSTVYLGAAAEATGSVLFSVDHHRGSEENQAGWEHHDADLVDPADGRLDTLPHWRRSVARAGLEHCVIGLVGDSATAAAHFTTPLSFCFIDGGHGAEPATADFEGWAPLVVTGGWLAIHDVFEDPADGGRPPYDLWCRALDSGDWEDDGEQGSLRVLRRRAAPRR